MNLMEKIQTSQEELDKDKEKIIILTKLTFSDLVKEGEVDPKLEAVLKEVGRFQAEPQKAQKGLQTLGNAQLILEGSKLQIRKSEVEIA